MKFEILKNEEAKDLFENVNAKLNHSHIEVDEI